MCVLISYSQSVWVWFGKQETNKLVLSLFLCAFQFTACYQVFRFIVVSSFARYRLTRPKQIFSYLSCYEITKGKLMAPGSSRCKSKYIKFTIHDQFQSSGVLSKFPFVLMSMLELSWERFTVRLANLWPILGNETVKSWDLEIRVISLAGLIYRGPEGWSVSLES